MKLKHDIDFDELRFFLESLNKDDIECMFTTPLEGKVYKLLEADTRLDLDRFHYESLASGGIIEYGEPFLVDALGNDLSILILSRRGV